MNLKPGGSLMGRSILLVVVATILVFACSGESTNPTAVPVDASALETIDGSGAPETLETQDDTTPLDAGPNDAATPDDDVDVMDDPPELPEPDSDPADPEPDAEAAPDAAAQDTETSDTLDPEADTEETEDTGPPADPCDELVCDDGDPCTGDACVDGACQHAPLSGLPCAPEDQPDVQGICVDGACELEQGCGCEDDLCDDGDPCTVDSCDETTCTCAHADPDEPCMDASNPWEVSIHFPHAEDGPDGLASMQTLLVPIPEGTTEVWGQVAIRGDLNYFPAAFHTLVVEQDGSLGQCGMVTGMPQLPNNLEDDVFRVAWPRPENLDPSSTFYPPSPPWDMQPLPCQQGFLGKEQVELGIVSAYISPPGVGDNQGPEACGGPGCPNDVKLTLRFEPGPGPPAPCAVGSQETCICPDGTFGSAPCDDVSGPGPCACQEPQDPDPPDPDEESTLGLCEDPLGFTVGPEAPLAVIAIPGSAFHHVPWPPVNAACFSSKPPFAIEHFYGMTVSAPGNLVVEVETGPVPWEPKQYWIDLQGTCQVPIQCGVSSVPLTGEVLEPTTFLVGVTLAPPGEIYLPDQGDWELTLKATWSPP